MWQSNGSPIRFEFSMSVMVLLRRLLHMGVDEILCPEQDCPLPRYPMTFNAHDVDRCGQKDHQQHAHDPALGHTSDIQPSKHLAKQKHAPACSFQPLKLGSSPPTDYNLRMGQSHTSSAFRTRVPDSCQHSPKPSHTPT